ncbi:MAG: phosphoribosylformylglycinamidine synthase [Clostridia bacterium]|nr:phosphoribosylformylglycinamidine synthase [Clostridia bacterium]
MIKRLFVEKTDGSAAKKTLSELSNVLGIVPEALRVFLRYDVEGLSDADFARAVGTVFSEPPVDRVFETLPDGYDYFGIEYLPGQYDQRADSAAQCVQLLCVCARPLIRTATVYAVKGLSEDETARVKSYLVNPVEARLCSFELPKTLTPAVDAPEPAAMVDGFIDFPKNRIADYHAQMGFAMSVEDLLFVQAHFKSERRNPTVTELKVIDTYWSDHCRHTTFLTHLEKIKVKSDMPVIENTLNEYRALFNKHHQGRPDKYPSLMDMATIGAREVKSRGHLENLDQSEEINACSIKVPITVDGQPRDYLVMFKNETHNHPTEIEPFGGAATCLGGAIRDPLSGRSYVYQSMRITGAGDINAPVEKTMKGKLPQRVISKTAAAGFSSYGNQIGLATGIVHEMYHPGYAAKRLETGFVVGAAPAENVVRSVPEAGDVVLLIGGETGRDGCGGATGSSKAHTIESIDRCGAEVQKGNPLTERKIQRLFRNPHCTRLIKRCNDFGAGGVSVAIGELSPGLDIDLDRVPKKYEGLSATELAISESQERMAVVVDKNDVEAMQALAAEENLATTQVATVTDTARMRMYCGGKLIVDLPRRFLDSNGVRQTAAATIKENTTEYFDTLSAKAQALYNKGEYAELLCKILSDYNVCSQKGLSEIFDSTIGAGTVLMPFGGKNQLTPPTAMAAKIPVDGHTDTATVASYGCDPALLDEGCFIGALYSVLLSVVKVAVTGVPLSSIRLTFQEFFERLRTDPERWGKPTAALLGALNAQLGFNMAAIGGKDSMSGSFEKLDVPPTLISFALGIGDAKSLITNVFARPDQRVYRVRIKRDKYNVPDYEYLTEFLKLLYGETVRGNVDYATVVEQGGAAAEIVKSCLGNGLGFAFNGVKADYFTPSLGDILISTTDPDNFVGYDLEFMGITCSRKIIQIGSTLKALSIDEYIVSGGEELALERAADAYTSTFAGVYPMTAAADGAVENVAYTAGAGVKRKKSKVQPTVFIPVFPGTNCEYDTARKFIDAGAKTDIFVIKNRTPADIEQAVEEIAKRIANSQIIAFPGGFSGGDEPDGSGKFIAATFKNPRIADAIHALLYKRGGLALGICNGFQALVKLGLLPYGEVRDMTDRSPTLTFNNIGRHVSTVVKVRVASNLSPWLSGCKVGDVYNVAVSHGEGKFIADDENLQKLITQGQIATQYADMDGNATMLSPFNPNGSVYGIEGITGADGRIFGKMGHSERSGKDLLKNVDDCVYDMKIFESGVKFFL